MADEGRQETIAEAVAELAPVSGRYHLSEPWRALAAVLRLRNHELRTAMTERDALAAQVEQLTRARDLLAGSLAREQVANGRLPAQVSALTAERDALREALETEVACRYRRVVWDETEMANYLRDEYGIETAAPPLDGSLMVDHPVRVTDPASPWHGRDGQIVRKVLLRREFPGSIWLVAIDDEHVEFTSDQLDATTPPAGAQEHEHDWQPAGHRPYAVNGALRQVDRCRICGTERFADSPDVQP